jgi:hypothetical protein
MSLEPESEIPYDRRFTTNQFVLATSPLRLTISSFFQLSTCFHSPYVTSSQTWGWVCRLELLLVLISTIILGSKSRATPDIFYCLKFEALPTWITRSPYLYPPGIGWSSCTPTHWVLFSSPPTTSRARVEVFELASTAFLKSKSYFDWRSISKSWCRAPSGAHYQIFITLWELRSCFSGAPFLTRGRVCLLYMILVLASVVFLGSDSLVL